MKRIKDPVRNQYILIEEPYLSAIEEPEFQRLRRIKQLGLTDLVYPGATHSRLIHSLGVFYTMKQMTSSIDIDSDTERQLKFAALLHDIGHGPFSHVSERVDSAPDHEERSCKLIEEFSNRGIIDSPDVVPIQEFIRGERRPHLLHGDIDADRLDYLLRDSYNTGNSAGVVEDHTITTQNIMLTEDNEVAFHHTARSALSGIPQARQAMYSAVYIQPTVRIAERMLEESIVRSDITGDELMELDDNQLLTYLRESSNSVVRNLSTQIANRNLYKMVSSTRFYDESEQINRDELQEELVAETGLEDYEVLVEEFPENPSSLSTLIMFDDGSMQEYEVNGSSSHIYNYDIGVFTPTEHEDTVKEICENYGF
jgi:HD superfamily phosphohydrolase